MRLTGLCRVTDGSLNGSWKKPDSPKWERFTLHAARICQAKSTLLKSSKKEMRVGRWEARKSLFHPVEKLNPNVSLFARYVIFTILLRIMPLFVISPAKDFWLIKFKAKEKI